MKINTTSNVYQNKNRTNLLGLRELDSYLVLRDVGDGKAVLVALNLHF